jgi:Amt family ammonium transporter
MLQSFMAMIIVTVLWVVMFGLSFGPTIGGIIGNPLPNLFSKRGQIPLGVSLNYTVMLLCFRQNLS